MKKTSSLLFIASILTIVAGCSDNNKVDDPDKDPEEIKIVDLGQDELANCYIVQSQGKYKFAAVNQFNLGEGLPIPPKISPVRAELVWQSSKGAIQDVEMVYEEGIPYVRFDVEKAEGNAVIAVYNEVNEIEWSWHIWMPKVNVYSLGSSTGYEVMNLNLGALTDNPGESEAYGMLYQWGRKDPFPASGTLTGTAQTVSAEVYDKDGNKVSFTNSSWTSVSDNTIEFAIANPTVCLSNYAQFSSSRDWLQASMSDDSLWGNPKGDYLDTETFTYPNKGSKTCYDPSPAGWRVPPCDVFRDFTYSGGYAWDPGEFNIEDLNGDEFLDLNDYNYGWNFYVNPVTSVYFPAASRFDGSYGMLMGSMSGWWGNYWSNSPYSKIEGGGFCVLAFQVKDQSGNNIYSVSPAAGGSRADAYSIRCIRDNP